uniref:IgGFc-binding protein N-terminal domain-containing protein n=1 Tax=Biomphalaria glabrata TaxID=6526 RepID=A0A2C9KN35_BIOGL
MLLSLDYYGLVYIVCKMQGGVAAGPVTVVTSSPFTNLQWKILKTVVRRNTLVNSGSRVEMLVNATMEVTADKPVGCFQIVFSPCRSSPDDFERVAMLQIVPVQMFFNFYSWSSLDTLNGSIQMHVYFIVQQSEIHLLTLKSTHPNSSVYWDTNSEYQGWITGSLAVARGVSHAWMRNFNYFGCYVMGVAEDAIVAQLLGFQKSCIKGAQQDCDGYSDKGFQALIVDNGDDISQECPPMTFGKDCSGDCAKKCNDDCLNKVDGTCRATSQYTRGLRGGNSNSSVFFGLIWFFLPGCALCFLSYLLASYKTYSARR